MGYHDLAPEAFLTTEVQQTNTAEEAFLFKTWIIEKNEKAKRLASVQEEQGVKKSEN